MRGNLLGEILLVRQTLQHGFPQNVTALAHDYTLGLMAVATRDGQIRIFGAKNVEWSTNTAQNLCTLYLYFAVGTGVLIALCSDQTFNKFQINGDRIQQTTVNPGKRLKRITSCGMQNFVDQDDARALIGTVTGNIFSISVSTLELSELVLFDENISVSVPSIKNDARSVEQIAVNPSDASKLLILFGSHIFVYFDLSTKNAIRHWSSQQSVTYVDWHFDGIHFIVSHTDGSLDTWSAETAANVESSAIPFGPFPCTSIKKIKWAKPLNELSMVKFFTGGMPRASYGDRYTITALREGRIVVFDFSSPVIDFFIVPALCDNSVADFSRALALMVLCEQELVCIDLTEKQWPVLELPYLHSLHSSPITCNMLYTNIEEHVWKDITKASELIRKEKSGSKKWPIFAGSDIEPPILCAATNVEKRQLLITGHENGFVNFWSTGSINMSHLFSVNTTKEFAGCFLGDELKETQRNSRLSPDDLDEDDDSFEEVSEWPPFRKVGVYDPFCDDPRFAISKIFFDSSTGQLAIGGNAGHAIVYDLESEPLKTDSVLCAVFDIVDITISNRAAQKPIPARKSKQTYSVGFQPFKANDNMSLFAQLRPAVSITAIASLHSRNLLALGCEYGFVLCDLKSQTLLIKNCLLSVEEISEVSALSGALTRFKSMKKSIRQSFRRKKRRQTDDLIQSEASCSNTEIRPMERQVQARSEAPLNAGDPPHSAIRILKFYSTNVLAASVTSDSFWVGTNAEVRLHHRAPVIDIACIAMGGSPSVKNMSSIHKIIVFTEEQIKTFSLPSMKPARPKCRLTGVEGSRLRKAQLLSLWNLSRKICEKFLLIVTNQGELILFSAVNLRLCTKVQFVRATDIMGIGSAVISPHGEIFFLKPGGSEFQRATITTVQHTNLLSPLRNHDFPHNRC
ncbi:unnamed protein product [Dracunculus medinensis]|uniref:LLGL domain-containing protein n=1 Tax=Dracunculus medinensis TaxID=318479 RepID=A0A0N4UD59_DRAME|nr:unnamed protein product [Dracunculus medinensis]